MLISKTLGDVEEMLPAEIFQRIHHSTGQYYIHFSIPTNRWWLCSVKKRRKTFSE